MEVSGNGLENSRLDFSVVGGEARVRPQFFVDKQRSADEMKTLLAAIYLSLIGQSVAVGGSEENEWIYASSIDSPTGQRHQIRVGNETYLVKTGENIPAGGSPTRYRILEHIKVEWRDPTQNKYVDRSVLVIFDYDTGRAIALTRR